MHIKMAILNNRLLIDFICLKISPYFYMWNQNRLSLWTFLLFLLLFTINKCSFSWKCKLLHSWNDFPFQQLTHENNVNQQPNIYLASTWQTHICLRLHFPVITVVKSLYFSFLFILLCFFCLFWFIYLLFVSLFLFSLISWLLFFSYFHSFCFFPTLFFHKPFIMFICLTLASGHPLPIIHV